MSTHALQSRPARAGAAPASTLAPARAFAAPETAAAAPAGHEFGAVAVGATSAQPIQRAGGKTHHNPAKKKYLASGVGAKQVAVSTKALSIKKAVPQGQRLTNKEAARLAKASLAKPKK